MKRKPPVMAVVVASVTALLGRLLWVSSPPLSSMALVAPPWATSGPGGGEAAQAADPRPAGDLRPPRGRHAPPHIWSATLPLLTQRRLTQHPSPPLPAEADLAYFIQVSPSNVALLPRLLAAVYHPDNTYAVHFDVKIGAGVLAETLSQVGAALSGVLDRSLAEQQERTKVGERRGRPLPHNVIIMERTPVTYRGITTVLNTLDGMTTLLDYSAPWTPPGAGDDAPASGTSARAAGGTAVPPWTYLINLSASDYPLLSAVATRRLLGRPDVASRGANFVTLHPREEWATATRNRFRRLVVDSGVGVLGSDHAAGARDTTLTPVGATHPSWATVTAGVDAAAPADAPPAVLAKGGAWMIVTRRFATYATTSGDARRALVSMANGLSSSEHFFPTLLLGPAWRDTLLPHSLRAVYWDPAWSGGVPAAEMQHPNTIDPVVPAERAATAEAASTTSDVPPPSAGPFGARVAGSPYLFARKFSRPDAPLLDWIDVHRLGRGGGGAGEGMAVAEARAATHLEWLLRLPPQQEIGA